MATAVVGLVLLLAIAGPLVAVRQVELRRRAAVEAERSRRLLYVSDMNVAQQAWKAAKIASVVKLLSRHQPKPGEEDLRGFEWYYFWQLCQRSLKTPLFQS